MKIKKSFCSLILATVALLAFAVYSVGQDATYYIIGGLNGFTNSVAPLTTNTYAAFQCDEYERIALRFTFYASTTSTGTVQVLGYKSLNSTLYETTPSLNQLITLTGTNPVTTEIEDNIGSASEFKLQLGNTNSTVVITNIFAGVRFKAPSVRLKN